MKIIHCADIHLGSTLTSIKDDKKRSERKNEIRNSFFRLVEYAKHNDIHCILLSGDIFDSDTPVVEDKNFFYDVISANKDISFYYLKGNHDKNEIAKFECENLFAFNDSWKSYIYNKITITGIEVTEDNINNLYSSLKLNENNLNIVMLHGDITNKGKDFIDLKKLTNKNIDYLALGHIHSYSCQSIDERGVAIYPGCLDGRGYDEIGEKGFVLLDIENNKIDYSFIPFSSRPYILKEIDVSGSKSLYDIQNKVSSAISDLKKESIVRIVLSGKVNSDAETDYSDIENRMESAFKDRFFDLRVKSEIKFTIDANKFKNEISLRGEFVRTVLSSDDEDKDEILELGLRMFSKEEVER